MPFWNAAWTSCSSRARWAWATATGSIGGCFFLPSMISYCPRLSTRAVSLQFPLQVRLRRVALALGNDIGRQVIEILKLLPGGGIRIIGIVVQLDQFLGIKRQPLDAALH